MAILSRLRRCFFSEPSTSTVYRRLQTARPRTLPIINQSDDRSGNDLKASTPGPIQNENSPLHRGFKSAVDDDDDDWFKKERAAIGEGEQPEATPPRYSPISDGECGSLKSLRACARGRIENELRAMNDNAPTHCSFGAVGDDIFDLEGLVIGPAGSCYDGGIFRLSIKLPSDYPCSPPKINFQTKIFHPNIDENTGRIYMDILEEKWSPALSIEKLLLSICSILADSNAEEASFNEASFLYNTDWLTYYRTAREWTIQYAIGT